MKILPIFPTAALPASGDKGIISAPQLRAPPSLRCKGRKKVEITNGKRYYFSLFSLSELIT